jgi:hypothetical protein
MALIALICISAAKESFAQNRAGTYGYTRGANASGEVKISDVNARSFRFSLGIGSHSPACIGELNGRATWIAPNVAVYQTDDGGSGCLLIFVFSGNDLIISEYPCASGNEPPCGHGVSCTYNGTYKRVSRRR